MLAVVTQGIFEEPARCMADAKAAGITEAGVGDSCTMRAFEERRLFSETRAFCGA